MNGDKTLIFATHNAGKLEEMRALLSPHGFTVTSNADHGLPEPEETESTFAGNALIKARAACAALGLPAVADDSGLSVDALNGAPGIYTADWAETGQGRDFVMAMERVWRELQESGAAPPFTAQFNSVIAWVTPDGTEHTFEGIIPGQIVWPIRGQLGHGFDPVFQPDGFDQTFAEMAPDQKNAISHRGRAVAKFLDAILG